MRGLRDRRTGINYPPSDHVGSASAATISNHWRLSDLCWEDSSSQASASHQPWPIQRIEVI
jgi:hypothetical protein